MRARLQGACSVTVSGVRFVTRCLLDYRVGAHLQGVYLATGWMLRYRVGGPLRVRLCA